MSAACADEGDDREVANFGLVSHMGYLRRQIHPGAPPVGGAARMRRKFGAAGREFSQGEFISPENIKSYGVLAKSLDFVGNGFAVVNMGDDRKVSDF